MRRRTAILLCLAIVSIGAGAYGVTRALSPDEPAKATASVRPTAPGPRTAPEYPVPRGRLTEKPPATRHRTDERRSRSTHRSHRSSRKHTDPAPTRVSDRAQRDPGLGGLTGGHPAPDSPRPAPVAAPATPVVVTPQVAAPAVPVAVPSDATIGTILDLIGGVTGERPAPSVLTPDQLAQECPPSSSGPGSGSSGNQGDGGGPIEAADIAREIVQLICSSTDRSGPGHGGDGGASDTASSDDRSGPGGGK